MVNRRHDAAKSAHRFLAVTLPKSNETTRTHGHPGCFVNSVLPNSRHRSRRCQRRRDPLQVVFKDAGSVRHEFASTEIELR